MENGVKPPDTVKVRFLEAIGKNSVNNPSINQTKVITMQNEKAPARNSGSSRFLAAASIILLVVVGWFAYHSNQQNKELQAANNVLKAKSDSTDNILNQIVAEQRAAKEHNVTVVNMVGTKIAPKSSANVFWGFYFSKRVHGSEEHA